MKNRYVDFITDEHFIACVANLHKSYLKAKNNISKKSFYTNKVDVIKLTFIQSLMILMKKALSNQKFYVKLINLLTI